MKIQNLQTERGSTFSQISATLIWEDRDRPEQKIYIRTIPEFAPDLSCNPHSFLLASAIVAFHFGERRLAIHEEICPELLEGLNLAMDWMKQWHNITRPPLQIESKISSPSHHSSKRRAAIFFSGGVDSLASLRFNHLQFAPDHPRYIQDGLIIHGLANTTLDSFEKAVTRLSVVAKDANISSIPIYTNIYSHIMDLEYDNYRFWKYFFAGSALASIAHAFHRRIHTISASSSQDIRHLVPWGTHPFLDPNYSSHDLRIRYQDLSLSRLDKVRIISDWEIALNSLRVCDELDLPHGFFNCGRCAKCVLTIAELSALGILEETKLFPIQTLTPQFLVKYAYPSGDYKERDYLDLIPLFQEQDRSDIIRAIKRICDRYRERDWQGWIKRFDRAFLNGYLIKTYKSTEIKDKCENSRLSEVSAIDTP
jgi:hypothetical protein